MNYFFGFSWKGFLVVLLPMIPNFFYFKFPNVISSGSPAKRHLVFDIIEHGSQAIYIALLLILITKQDVPIISPYIAGMGIFLLSYYALWILLFAGRKNLAILICMAVFPVVYFILAEFWLHNFPTMIPTAIFGIVHVIITYRDYHLKS